MAAPSLPPIAAIPTRFLGILYRSRLEARWAVFLTSLRIAFLYEPEGFRLPPFHYLPDFYFPQVRMWAEVKPCAFTNLEKRKCVLLADIQYAPVLMLIGAPALRTYTAVHKVDIEGIAERLECDYLLDPDYHKRKLLEVDGRFWACTTGEIRSEYEFTEDYKDAVIAALSFRFDEGGKW